MSSIIIIYMSRFSHEVRFAAGLALSAAAWGGLGVAVGAAYELHTNEVAADKALTAQACADSYAAETVVITEQMIDCMSNAWVPGGRHINASRFHPDTPIGLLEGYVQIQQAEARQIEPGRILVRAGWFALLDVAFNYLGRRKKPLPDGDPGDKEDLPDDEKLDQIPIPKETIGQQHEGAQITPLHPNRAA